MQKSVFLSSAVLAAIFAPGIAMDRRGGNRGGDRHTYPQPLAVTGSSVSVITATDIDRQQIDIVSDALGQTTGLTVVRSGGVGQPTNILLRGAEGGQTLVLIDGVRINDPVRPRVTPSWETCWQTASTASKYCAGRNRHFTAAMRSAASLTFSPNAAASSPCARRPKAVRSIPIASIWRRAAPVTRSSTAQRRIITAAMGFPQPTRRTATAKPTAITISA